MQLKTNLRTVIVTVFVILSSACAQSTVPSADEALLLELQRGGYTIYFRHAATESQSDSVNALGDWTSCDPAQMRQLSEAGRETSRSIGDAFRTLAIPVGQVVASEYCRTVETAELMNLGQVEPTTDILNTRSAGYVGGQEALVDRARQRLGISPQRDTNTVLVGHGNVISAAAGVSLSEGEAAVFRPLENGQFEFVAIISPDIWRQWLKR